MSTAAITTAQAVLSGDRCRDDQSLSDTDGLRAARCGERDRFGSGRGVDRPRQRVGLRHDIAENRRLQRLR